MMEERDWRSKHRFKAAVGKTRTPGWLKSRDVAQLIIIACKHDEHHSSLIAVFDPTTCFSSSQILNLVSQDFAATTAGAKPLRAASVLQPHPSLSSRIAW